MRQKSIRLWSVLISVFVILAVMPAVVFAGNTDSIQITTHPQDITAQSGESKTMKVVATNATSYQWQRSSDEGETWTNIGSTNVNYVGARTADLTIIVGKTTASYVYRCVVSNGANTEMTEVATLTLKSPVEITAQPKSVSGKAGDVKTLTVKASYATSYQWQRSSDDGETWTNIGASNAS